MSAFVTLPLPNFHGQMALLNFMIRLVSPLQFNISSPFHHLIMKNSESLNCDGQQFHQYQQN
jgi:hypothetical protein